MDCIKAPWRYTLNVPGQRAAKLSEPPPFEEIVHRLCRHFAPDHCFIEDGSKPELKSRGCRRVSLILVPKAIPETARETLDYLINSVHGYRAAFYVGPREIEAPRWVQALETDDWRPQLGVCAPVLERIEVKGAWLDEDGDAFIDPDKADRSKLLHNLGWV
jgi:hypothetical protein